MKKNISLLLIFFLATVCRVDATHIVGGEINYKYLGNSDYAITLTVYRDCNPGSYTFDNPAYIGIFDSDNNFLFNKSIPLNDFASIPLVSPSPCIAVPGNICYEVAHYYITLNLPPRAGGYLIAYQRCCRNNSIINIISPGATGDTFTAIIPDVNIVPVNNNPVFKNLPPVFICLGENFVFDHSATDADGDLLTYELCTPFSGATQSAPQPTVPSAPPYDEIVFQSPYSLANVMGGTPMAINSTTGILTAKPSGEGQFVYGIRVKEFRNGNFIGETRRDYQVNVVNCERTTVASIFSPVVTCGTFTANFENQSVSAVTYSWFFGDPTTNADTSHDANPVYNYPQPGTYHATLIAYASNPACNDTDTAVVLIHPFPVADFSFTPPLCDSMVHFINASTNGTSYLWGFGDGPTSTETNPFHQYDTTGFYNVTLIAYFDGNCRDTVQKHIEFTDFGYATNNIVPNIFTPNGDDKNETFWFLNAELCPFENFSIVIFNRWGNKVYESNDYNFKWDGKDMNGKDCAEGVYYYAARSASGKLNGYIHLVR